MKVLIYGSNGWIGSQFIAILSKENITFVEGHSRVDDVEKLHQEIDTVQPTHIVSFIGRTHGSIGSQEFTTIDYLEQEGKLVVVGHKQAAAHGVPEFPFLCASCYSLFTSPYYI